MARHEADQELIQEPAAAGRIALDQRQVLRREEHRLADAEQVPGTDRVAPVDPAAVGPARVDFQFQHGGLLATDQLGPDHGPLGAEPQQRRVRADPVRGERGQIPDRFHQVGLADAVGTHQDGDSGLKAEIHLGVAAEIGEREFF